MAKLVMAQKISLKNHPEIHEDAIQQFIFDNPSVLGLGEISPIRREKVQPSGGRLDLLLGDDEVRYEVEIMLGATDPSHIIRTIEYWDNERKRYPQYDHCAVIVAEEITGRFMNVISLFNGAIPLIALQMSATKHGDNINLDFVRVIDRITTGSDDDDSENASRDYWAKKTEKMNIVDKIYGVVKEYNSAMELKYKKSRICISKGDSYFNTFLFYPRQKNVKLVIKCPENKSFTEGFENTGLDYEYRQKSKTYRVKFFTDKDFTENEDFLREIIKSVVNTEETGE